MTTTAATQDIDEIRTPAAAQSAAPALADPTALAFACVGLTFGVISLNLTGALSADVGTIVLPLALGYGTLGLLFAGVAAFKLGDSFGAFTYTSLCAFFFSFALIQLLLAMKVIAFVADGSGTAFAVFLLGWNVIITYLMLLSFTYPVVFRVIFVGVWLSLILLAIGFAQSEGVLKAGAWLGVISAVLCLYASAAVLTNTMRDRQVLPI